MDIAYIFEIERIINDLHSGSVKSEEIVRTIEQGIDQLEVDNKNHPLAIYLTRSQLGGILCHEATLCEMGINTEIKDEEDTRF